jgi:integrase/recombinase XerD
LLSCLKTLLALRKYWVTHSHPNFIFPAGKNLETHHGTKISIDRDGLQNLSKLSLKAVALKMHITIHSLRHYYGAHLVETGLNLRSIQHEMGHDCPKTTTLYTQLTDAVHQNTNKLINRLVNRLNMTLNGSL